MTTAGLVLGLLLFGAIIGATIAHRLRVPRVIGYLIAGAILKALVLLVSGEDRALIERLHVAEDAFGPVLDLALGLILFLIGSVFEVRHLRRVGRVAVRCSASEIVTTSLLVFVGILIAGLVTVMHSGDQTDPRVVVVLAALLACGAIATAPAATLFVINEFDAKGTVTDTILSLTGLNNAACIVLFQLVFLLFAGFGLIQTSHARPEGWGLLLLDLGLSVFGSAVLGLVIGMLLSVAHAKLRPGDMFLAVLGVVLLLSAGESWLVEQVGMSYNFLLTSLCIGAVFTNVAIDPDQLESTIKSGAAPVFIGFFVIAGYKLHLAELAEIGLIGAVYVVCRAIGKVVGVWLGVLWADDQTEQRRYAGAGLLCQAAVIIGLSTYVGEHWDHPWASRFMTTVLGSVVIFELCGPVLLKSVITRAGEVKAVTLLRREGHRSVTTMTAIGLAIEALLRTLGLGRLIRQGGAEGLTVRHVMRTNVRCLPSSSRFDEVLQFVERSRFNDFPVIDEDGSLVGLIHFKDIREIMYDPQMSLIVTAGDMVAADTPSVHADMTLEEVLEVFQGSTATALPVTQTTEGKRVIGIVDQRDVLRSMHVAQS